MKPTVNHSGQAISPLIWVVLLLCIVPNGLSQGTVRFDFEGLPLGSQPPYIRDGYNFQTSPRVSENGAEAWIKVPTHDGQQFAVSTGVIRISSPTAEPIREFSLDLYITPPPLGYTLDFRVQDHPWTIQEFNSWHTLRGTFDTPVDEIWISGFSYITERFPVAYGIDAVELVTVPEPGTSVLLLVGGLVAALLRQRRECLKRRTNTCE